MFFEDPKRQEAGAFGLLDGVAKIRGRQLLPLRGKLGLRVDGTSSNERYQQGTNSRTLHGNTSTTRQHFSPIPRPRGAAFSPQFRRGVLLRSLPSASRS